MNQQLDINFSHTLPVKCNCGNEVFSQTVMLRKVPRLMTGGLKDGLAQIPTFNCIACGELLEIALPDELKTTPYTVVEDDKPSKLIL